MSGAPFTRHNLLISTLSPVHMGTGDDYDPTGYVIQDQTLHAFHGEALIDQLPANERKKLDDILAARPDDRMLRQVQRFFYDNRERLIPAAHRRVRLSPAMESFYRDRVGNVAQHETGGNTVQNKLEIQRTAFAPALNRPILPGSGIKGAIRTALLDAINDGNSIPESWKRDRFGNQKLQLKLFEYGNDRDRPIMHKDPLRLMRIADASPITKEADQTKVHFAVNRKKSPVTDRDGKLAQSKAEQQNLYQLLECLPAPLIRAYQGELTLQANPGEPQQEWPQWQPTLAEIAIACNHFYRPILENELQAMGKRGYLETTWASGIQGLLEGELGKAMDQGQCFLLRVGRHSGAESVTLNGVRDIKIMRGKGEKPDFQPTAKTWWLAADERQMYRGLLPFGWLLIEIIEDQPRAATDLTAFGQRELAAIRGWLDQNQERYQALQEKLELERQQRVEETARRKAEQEAEKERQRQAEETEQARIQAEQEAKAQAQAEYDALPPEQKAIADFEQALEPFADLSLPLDKDRYAELARQLNAIGDQAVTWNDVKAKADAAHAIETACERFGWHAPGLNKRQRERKEAQRRQVIEQLRGG